MNSTLPSEREYAENALDLLLTDTASPKAVSLKIKLMIAKEATPEAIERVFERGMNPGLSGYDVDMFVSHPSFVIFTDS